MTYVLRVKGPKTPIPSTEDEVDQLALSEITMEEAMKTILKDENISDDVWNTSRNGQQFRVEFDVVGPDNLERIMDRLAYYNIGKTTDSAIMMIEATAYVAKKQTQKVGTVSENSFKKFVNSLKSRMTVAQVYHSISQRGSFTIDYLSFLLCAAVLADIALVTNRPSIIFASMLLSPMMDPILCILFGLNLQERKMTIKGVKNASISLFLCIACGLLCGYGMHLIAILEDVTPYPTDEIMSRGNYIYLVNIILVTLFSGISVAFAILNNVVSALIGNAISLSLLPPAVNCGHLLFLTFLAMSDKEVAMSTLSPVSNSSSSAQTAGTAANLWNPSLPAQPDRGSVQCNYPWIKKYKLIYTSTFCEASKEFAIMAAFSLFVSILNIVVVLGIGYIVCRIKDMAPKSFTNPETRKFYKKDVKEYRDTYKTLNGNELDANQLATQAYREYLTLNNLNPDDESSDLTAEENQRITSDFQAVLKGVKRDRHFQTISAQAGTSDNFFRDLERASAYLDSPMSGRHWSFNSRRRRSHRSRSCEGAVTKDETLTNEDPITLNHLTVGRGRPLRNLAIREVTLGSYGNQIRRKHLQTVVEQELSEGSTDSEDSNVFLENADPQNRHPNQGEHRGFYQNHVCLLTSKPGSAVSVSKIGKFDVVTTLDEQRCPLASGVSINSKSRCVDRIA